jgi:general L-amino acid transport system substrate-binding protein
LDYDIAKAQGFEGDEASYEIGSNLFTKSFETWLTRRDDRVWSKFTSWLLEALIEAEESGITKSTSDQMATTEAFGPEFRNMFQNAVNAVGNFGDMWEPIASLRIGKNSLNDGTSGLLLSMDMGNIDTVNEDGIQGFLMRQILVNGQIKCGVVQKPGFALYNETTGSWTGLEIDICKGISAALFRGEIKMEVVELDFGHSFYALTNETVDVMFGFTRTMEREVNYAGSESYDFSPPYFHDGLIFAGPLPHGKCAEDQNFGENCTGTVVCVPVAELGSLNIPVDNMIVATSIEDAILKHTRGECNAIAGAMSVLDKNKLEDAGYQFGSGEYYIGKRRYTKQPLSVVSRSIDSQFSDFLRWIIYGFIYAEETGIKQSNAALMPQVFLFGDAYSGVPNMWRDSIGAVGNYGTMYESNLEGIVAREGLNLLNDGGGQVYAYPGTL